MSPGPREALSVCEAVKSPLCHAPKPARPKGPTALQRANQVVSGSRRTGIAGAVSGDYNETVSDIQSNQGESVVCRMNNEIKTDVSLGRLIKRLERKLHMSQEQSDPSAI